MRRWRTDAAALGAALFGYEASSFFDTQGGLPRVEALCAAILAEQGTRLPGARRLALRAKAAAEGLAIPDPLHAELARRAAG